MHFYGWKKGLKTGMYYLRTRAAADAIKFTVDQQVWNKEPEIQISAYLRVPPPPQAPSTSRCDLRRSPRNLPVSPHMYLPVSPQSLERKTSKDEGSASAEAPPPPQEEEPCLSCGA